MRTVTASAQIPAPPTEVFEFLADLQNLPRWQSGIMSAELTTPEPIGVGSTARIVRDLLGRHLTVDVTLVDYDPGRRLQLESAASGVGVQARLDLEPNGGGTALSFTMDIRAQNVFMGPVEGMVAGAAEQELTDSLERVRSHFAREPAA